MEIRFLEPAFLLLLLLVPVVWFVPRRVEDWRHALLRSALLALVAIAAAQPVSFREERSDHQVFVLDRSPSTGRRGPEDAALRGLLERSRPDANLTLIELGNGEPFVDSDELLAARERRDGSDVSAVLAAALRRIPAESRGSVTLISDGHATRRAWGAALQEFTERGIPLHTVRVDGDPDDLRVVGFRARETLRVGQTSRLWVELAGRSQAADVIVTRADEEVARRDGVVVDGRASVVLEFEPPEAGFDRLTVTVAADDDRRSGDESLTNTFAVQDPIRVLYLGERMLEGSARLRDLVGGGFQVEEPRADDGGATVVPANYDLVMLDDRPAESVPESLQSDLVEAVTQAGTGLLATGGQAAFGPGGWHETVVSSVLPVEFVQKEEKRDPSTTLVIIIDTSGSMGGNRVQLAKEVARLSMRRLLPHDKVGIVEFYGAKRWAAPIQPASNLIDLQRAINRMDAGGGTVIMPAIEESFYALQNVQTRYKHVLVLTDGGVEQGAFEPLVRKMADKGMTVSTVLIGGDAHSEFLVNIANWGKGRFYSVPNRFNLPEIILKQPTTSRLPAYRPGEHVVTARGGPGWWGDVDPTQVPALSGYVEARSRAGSEVLLETKQGAHPVLASWRYGLGRVTTFLSEPTGPGTENWRDWDGFGRSLARVMTRTAADSALEYEFELARRDRELTLTARRNRPGTRVPRARLVAADGEFVDLEFQQRADGVYTATTNLDPLEEARVLAGVAGDPRETVVRLCSPAHEDVAPEGQVDPRHALDLARAADATGGRTLAAGELASFAPRSGGSGAPVEIARLWPLALFLALLTYLADILWRRRPRAAVPAAGRA